MSNLAKGRVNLKLNSVLVQKRFYSLYSNFILNLYIVHKLKTWPLNPANNFTLKIVFFFGTVKLVRNTIKSKFAYNGGGIGYNGEVSWSFGNEFARNVAIFGVDNSSSCHTDTRKTQGINDCNGSAEKKV